jgi:hypothetical protein
MLTGWLGIIILYITISISGLGINIWILTTAINVAVNFLKID